MTYRARIKYKAKHKKELWDRWQKSNGLWDIGRGIDWPSSSIFSILSPTDGATYILIRLFRTAGLADFRSLN